MIPLHIADKAIINCNKEIEKLQIENARLKAEVERLTNQRNNLKIGLMGLTKAVEDAMNAAKEGKPTE
jgi:predicted RNase H-like nuclease (RuvC/YqgF family)